MQKPFVLLIKCMDVQNLAAFFSRPPVLSAPRLPILPGKAYGFSEILSGISPYLPRQQRELFSQIQPLLEMLQLFFFCHEPERRRNLRTQQSFFLFQALSPGTAGHFFHLLPAWSQKQEPPKQMDRNWTNSPSLQIIDPQKPGNALEVSTEQGKGKAQKDLLPFLGGGCKSVQEKRDVFLNSGD